MSNIADPGDSAFTAALEREHAGAQLALLSALTTVNGLLSLGFVLLFRPAGPLVAALGAAFLLMLWIAWTRSLTQWALNLRRLASLARRKRTRFHSNTIGRRSE